MDCFTEKIKDKPPSISIFRYLNDRERKGCTSEEHHKLEQTLFAQYPGHPQSVEVPIGARTVFILTMSPDRRHFAAAHGDHTVRVYCCFTGRLLHTKVGHRRSPWCLQYHPVNPNLLASGCLNGQVRVWDLNTGTCTAWSTSKCRQQFNPNSPKVIASLSFHPVQPILAVASEHEVIFWNWKTCKHLQMWSFSAQQSKVRWVQFGPSGDCFYTGSGNKQMDDTHNVVSSIGDPTENRDLQPMYTFIREEWARIQIQVRHDQLTHLSPTPQTTPTDTPPSTPQLAAMAQQYAPEEDTSDDSDWLPDDCVAFVDDDSDANDVMTKKPSPDFPQPITLRRGDSQRMCPACVCLHQQSPSTTAASNNTAAGSPVATASLLAFHLACSGGAPSTSAQLPSSTTPGQPLSSTPRPPTVIPSPENSTFECLRLLKAQIKHKIDESEKAVGTSSGASSSSGDADVSKPPPSKMGRLEQQLFSLRSNSSASSSQFLKPPAPSSTPISSNDHRNQPRPVQVIAAQPSLSLSSSASAPSTREEDCTRFTCCMCGKLHQARPLVDQTSATGSRSAQRSSSDPCLITPQTPDSPSWPLTDSPSSWQQPPTATPGGDPIWMAMESRSIGRHRDYGVPILDQTVNMTPTVRRLINQTLAGLFFGRGDPAVATNLLDTTYKIYRWDLKATGLLNGPPASTPGRPRTFNRSHYSVIVRSCKLHNDSSVSLSPDGHLLAVFVAAGQFPDETILSVYATSPGPTQATCIYTKKFGPNAISVEFSPLSDMLLVGLASRRIHHVIHHQLMVIGQVYKLSRPGAGEHSMQEVVTLHHPTDASPRSYISINGMIWTRTGGVIYATSNAQIFLVHPSPSRPAFKHGLRTVGTQTHSQHSTRITTSLLSSDSGVDQDIIGHSARSLSTHSSASSLSQTEFPQTLDMTVDLIPNNPPRPDHSNDDLTPDPN